MKLSISALFALLICVAMNVSSAATAATYNFFLESDTDRSAGQEIFKVDYDDLNDLSNTNAANSGFTQLDIGPQFSIAGVVYDGQYQFFLESDADRSAGQEIFQVTFNTLDDLSNSNAASSGFTQLDIGSQFSIAGVTFDGQYRFLLESDADRSAGQEIFQVTYDDLFDLSNSNAASSGFTQLDIGSQFSIAGVTFDGQYRFLLESDSDRSAGQEIFQVTYDDLFDLSNSNAASSGFTQLDIGSQFSIAGLAYDGFPPPPNGAVPLPAAGWMLIAALGSLGWARRFHRS